MEKSQIEDTVRLGGASELQAQYDECLADLPTLNFNDSASLLAWFEKIQWPSEHTGVRKALQDRERILEVFNAHGYTPDMNIDNALDKEDEDKAADFIIGQCLSDLDKTGGILQAAHLFIARWRYKFHPEAP